MMIKKVNDITKKESDFKYKVIPHKNGLDCLHCDFEEREKSLKDMIEKGSDNETIPKDGGGKVIFKKSYSGSWQV